MRVWDFLRSDGTPAPSWGCPHVFDELHTGVRLFGGWIIEARCIHCRTRATTKEQRDEAQLRSTLRENERLEQLGL